MTTTEQPTDRYELGKVFREHIERYTATLKQSAVADKRGEITWREPSFGGLADTINLMLSTSRYLVNEWERDVEAKKKMVAELDALIRRTDSDAVTLEAIQTKAGLLGLTR